MEPRPASTLNAIETEIIDLCVNGVRALGLPRSLGEIYGLIYSSVNPVSLDDLVERLQISKGSASQGLKFLRNLGAIKRVYVAGERRDHFVAEAELKKLVNGFLKEELEPHLESGQARLDRLDDLLVEMESGQKDFYQERVTRLRKWHERTGKILPLIRKFLG
ncbi:MAG: hypothetical protein AAF514_04550 [Verrucomicrobiota bacterium]